MNRTGWYFINAVACVRSASVKPAMMAAICDAGRAMGRKTGARASPAGIHSGKWHATGTITVYGRRNVHCTVGHGPIERAQRDN